MNIYIKDNIPYKVELADFIDDEGSFGHTLNKQQLIQVQRSMKPEARRATLVHEIVHAVMCVYGFEQTNTFNQEQVCEFIACHGSEIMLLADDVLATWESIQE